jgi:prevent-host-death family protein
MANLEIVQIDVAKEFNALLERVEKGEEITITRHGKPVARLVPPARSEEQKAKAREAVAAIRELRKSVKPDPDGLTVLDYIAMGRRY